MPPTHPLLRTARLGLGLEQAAGADVDDVEDVEARDDRGRDEGDQAWDA